MLPHIMACGIAVPRAPELRRDVIAASRELSCIADGADAATGSYGMIQDSQCWDSLSCRSRVWGSAARRTALE